MHDLFRDFVRQQVSARGAKRYKETARKAAALHLQSGRPLDALQIFIELGDTSALLNAIDSSPIPLHDLDITPILAAAIEGETPESLNLGALLLLTNHWTRSGLAAKGLRYAEELLTRPGAESHHLFCALKTISIFTHYYPAENQRAWLARLPDLIDRLDASHYTQALAYRANYCCRFPDLADDSEILLKAVLGNLQNLEPLDRFGVFMVNASTYLFLDDRESALRSTRQAVGVAQILDDSSEVVKALNMLGMILYHRCDSEFEIVSEQLRQMVVGRGIWRFSQASHWIPAEYYARCGNSQKALEASRLFDDVIVADDTLRRLLLYVRRITAVLINLIDGKYPIILADIAKFGLPEGFAERYEIAIAAAFSHAFLGDDVRAAHYLFEAKASREQFGRLSQEDGVFNRLYGEVIALCSVGRWLQARRLLSQHGEALVGSPFFEVLKLLSDGPPFAGVSATLRPFAERPYSGMLALLANRVVEKWSEQKNEPLLTAAETDVLRLIGLGKSNKDIANVRSRSTETVKRQVASLLRKLGVENRTSAVAVGRERGLL